MLKKIFFLALIVTSIASFAQEKKTSKASDAGFSFDVIENVPVYPGCTGNDNEVLKKCMSEKISAFINMHFDMNKMANNLPPNIYRASVQFKINKNGKVVDVTATAEYPIISNEAIRVVSSLPQMIPGKQKGEPVGVLYALPIIFKVEAPEKEKSKRKRTKKS